jgi:hypothetical protein
LLILFAAIVLNEIKAGLPYSDSPFVKEHQRRGSMCGMLLDPGKPAVTSTLSGDLR